MNALQLAITHCARPALWLLAAPAPAPSGEQAPWWANASLIFPVAIGVMLIMLMNKSGRGGKDNKAQAEMLKNLKRGDRIQTIGGVLGTVNDVRDNEVVVKVDETSNIKMRFTREAIRRVIVEDDKTVEARK